MRQSDSPRPAEPESVPSAPSGPEVVEQLNRILASKAFEATPRLGEFLEFVVRAALGSGEPLKETSIGVELLGRPADYDPKSDSIVRTQARRVRERLDGYYREEGRDDRVGIEIPKGGYLPVFAYRRNGADGVWAEARPGAGVREGGRSRKTWRWRLGGGLAAAGVVAVAGWMALMVNGKRVEKEVHIVVLPFQPVEPRPEDELYGQAIANAVVASLTRRDHFRVTVGAKAGGGSNRDVAYREQLVANAGSDYLVSGHLDRRAGRSSITAKLVRLADGGVVWSRRYVLDWRDLVRVEEELGETVAGKLAAHLGEGEARRMRRKPARSLEANREFLNGHFAAAITRQTVRFANFDRARAHLERALELDPGYADAHAALALLMSFRVIPWREGNEAYLEGAERHAKRALEEVEGHPEALAALVRCSIVRRDWRQAIAYAKGAVRSEPWNADALTSMGDVYQAMGFYEAALLSYEGAVKQAYVAMEPYVHGSLTAARLGLREKAERMVGLYSEYDAESVIPTTLRGIVRTRLGEAGEGEAIHRRTMELIEKASAATGSWREGEFDFVYLALAHSLVRQGRLEETKAVMAKVPGPTPRRVEDEILVLGLLRDREKTKLALRETRDFGNYRFLVTRPELRFLYGDPEFVEMVERAYGEWTDWLREFGAELPARPPELPAPAEALRGPGR